jgi:hypothetical protein
VVRQKIKGTFNPGRQGLFRGSQLFGTAKGSDDVRPVQNPDADRIVAPGVVHLSM